MSSMVRSMARSMAREHMKELGYNRSEKGREDWIEFFRKHWREFVHVNGKSRKRRRRKV